MGRHTHRFEHGAKHPELLPTTAFAALLHVPRLDAMLASFGATWSLRPDGGGTRWPDHVQWGADQLVELARHLRAGRTVAALTIARRQLERWTLNLADYHGIEPREGEGQADLIRRAWSVYPWLEHDMGGAWSELSECIHGRGDVSLAQHWEALAGDIRTQSIDVPEPTLRLHDTIAVTAAKVFTQVRGCVRTLALASGNNSWGDVLMNEYTVTHIDDLPDVGREALFPMDPELAYSPWADEALRVARGYRQHLGQAVWSDSVESLDARSVLGSLRERRARAIARFRTAMDMEAELLGDKFGPGTLLARLFRYVAIAEASEVASLWAETDEESASLRLAAGALRSSWYLWLEDTDLSLPCVRVLLEQTCRARTRRIKPQRASRIAESPQTASPARWIEACGWRRALVLGRALGEFSHISLRSRWSGARRLLEELQHEVEPPSSPQQTARGHALEAAAYLLAWEVIERLEIADDGLASGFREEVTLLDTTEHQRRIDGLLERAHSLRMFDFGGPDLVADAHVNTEEDDPPFASGGGTSAGPNP